MEAALDTTIGGATVPREYVIFQFCREFHCLPQDLDDMDEATLQMFLGFMRAEGRADEAKRRRQEFFGGKG